MVEEGSNFSNHLAFRREKCPSLILRVEELRARISRVVMLRTNSLKKTMRKYLSQNSENLLSVVFLLTVLFIASESDVAAAPEADLWPYWKQHNQNSNRSIDHSEWGNWLNKFLVQSSDGVHRIKYGMVGDQQNKQLDRYLETLQEVTVTNLNRDEQMAYWINLYNALTVDVVLQHYPVNSIRDIDISPGWFSSGPWDKTLITVEGKKLTLNDIEHRILRPIWKDPRIHFAVNCASVGCPNLAAKPYTADRLDQMLNKAARRYVNDPRGVTIKENRLIVSSIFSWYQSDFGSNEQEVIEYLKSYAKPELKKELDRFQSIYDTKYDWSLNDHKTSSGK